MAKLKAVARPAPPCTCTCEFTGGGWPALSCHAVFEQPDNSATKTSPYLTGAILPLLAGPLQAVSHCCPFGRIGRRLDQDLLAAGAVQLAQRGVELLRIRLRVARHAQPEVHALVGSGKRQHRDAFAF